MKISSKSILSPTRPAYSREPPPPIALSTSLTLTRTRSRRLTNSRSIKGAASPAMFPVVTGKKRGSGFDNPEPSSPKVTCIGQVRVKTKKKHVKNIRSLSRKRKLEHSRSQRSLQRTGNNNSNSNSSNNNNNNRQWVHIPLTICETLRTFGSEVSCLFPCRSPCLSTENNEERKHGWVVALQDEEEEMDDGNNVRRHVFNDLEIVNDVIIGSRDEGRVSICVPPKNALLLMRCRSDPVKMEALTSRVWEPTLEINEEEDEVNDQEEDKDMEEIVLEMEMKQSIQEEDDDNQEKRMETNDDEEEDDDSFFLGNLFEEEVDYCMEDGQEQIFEDEVFQETETWESNIEKVKYFEEEIETRESNTKEVQHFEEENEEMLKGFTERSEILEKTYEEIDARESSIEKGKQFEEMLIGFIERSEISKETYEELYEDVQETEVGESTIEKVQQIEDKDVQETETGESNVEKAKQSEEEFEEMLTEFAEEMEVENGENEEREKIEAVPECLLLMMYEPKLSMEVSKETWVRSSDFIRCHSSKKKPPPPPTEPIDNNVMNMVAVQYEPVAQQPIVARSSCSFPAALRCKSDCTMIAVLEKKLVNMMGFEPLALTRCKSEPMRRARESCSWQNQLEPPRRASFGVGMTGLG